MRNVEPKSRFDDDADFGASFVLSRGEVEDALASARAEPANDGVPNRHPTALRKKLIYAGAAAAAVVLVVVAVLFV